MYLNTLIRDVENFPKEGILFKDITPLLQDAKGLQESIDKMAESVQDVDFDIVIGPESRGFIFGVPLAYKLQKGFVPVRKPGKLPYETILATGGTTKAIVDLVEKLGGEVVKIVYLIELEGLNGRELLKGQNIVSLLKY